MQQDLFGAICVLIILLFGVISALWLYLRNLLDDNDTSSAFLRCIFGLRRKRSRSVPHLIIARSPVDDCDNPKPRFTLFSRLENIREGLISPFSNKNTPTSPHHHVPPEVLDVLAKWGGQPGHDYSTFNNGEYYNKISPALKHKTFLTPDFFTPPEVVEAPEIIVQAQPRRKSF
uniref:Uncharacterized protein n=1 Tax=Panagrellus redivivus TaxID=6233 RepID=A0A7E4VNL4_PANRE